MTNEEYAKHLERLKPHVPKEDWLAHQLIDETIEKCNHPITIQKLSSDKKMRGIFRRLWKENYPSDDKFAFRDFAKKHARDVTFLTFDLDDLTKRAFSKTDFKRLWIIRTYEKRGWTEITDAVDKWVENDEKWIADFLERVQ